MYVGVSYLTLNFASVKIM